MPILCIRTSRAERARTALLDALDALTPLLEDGGPQTVYLEMHGVRGTPRTWFTHVRAILAQLGLTGRVGLARNRVLARLAALRRDGTIVRLAQETAFLRSTPVALLELDPQTEERLAALGLHMLGHIADLPPGSLARRFGATGAELARFAHGIDERPLRPYRRRANFSRTLTYEGGILSQDALGFALRELLEGLAADLAAAGLQTLRLDLTLEDENERLHEFPVFLGRPSAAAAILLAVARARLSEMTFPAPIRTVCVTAHELEEGGTALELVHADAGDIDAITLAIARIQAALGEHSALRYRAAPAHDLEARFSAASLRDEHFRPAAVSALPQLSAAMLVYRRLTPRAVRVRCRHGRPAWVDEPGRRVVHWAGPWRREGIGDEACRDAYDVLLEDGRLLRIAKTAHGWQLDGCYE